MQTDLCRPAAEFLSLLFQFISKYSTSIFSYRFVFLTPERDRHPSSVSYGVSLLSRTGLNITISTNPIFTMITLFFTPITSCYALSRRHARMLTCQHDAFSLCLRGYLQPCLHNRHDLPVRCPVDPFPPADLPL